MPSKLLLADDSVTIQRVIELTFADEDIQVIAVGDGQQAISRIEAERPDIVLADVGMPERNGYEVASFVKRSPHLAHIPVLLLTGAFEPVDEGKARAAGCNGVLVKPFEPQMVINRVRDLLAGRRTDALWPAASGGEPQAPAVTPASGPAGSAESLDDYFDRLDVAFAEVKAPELAAAAMAEPAAPAMAEPAAPAMPEPAAPAMAEPESVRPAPPEPFPVARAEPSSHGGASPLGSDVFDTLEPGPVTPDDDGLGGWDPDLSGPEPGPAEVARRPSSAEPERPGSVEQPPVRPAGPVESAPPAPARPEPAPGAPAPAATEPVPAAGLPSLSDAFAALLSVEQGYASRPVPAVQAPVISDEVVELVVARVLERLTSDAVRDTVVDVAERLVREEIARIKSSVR